MICYYCNQAFRGDEGQVKCKISGKEIPGPIYYSKQPCNCPLEKQSGSNLSDKSSGQITKCEYCGREDSTVKTLCGKCRM